MMLYPDNSIILAPLSGFTDLPYRNSMRRHGCQYAFTEMVDASSLAYGSERTEIMLRRAEHEPWLGVQLVGCHPERIAKAVDILNRYNFDVIDFNLGCPAPKVARKGAGAILGSNIDQAAALLEIIVKKSTRPVTAKIRILSEDDPAPTLALTQKLINAGAQAITVHGRIRQRYYAGPVHYDIIAAIRDNSSVQIIGNGNIMSRASYRQMRQLSGCSTVMVARGAMGNPWLFEELQTGDNYQPPTVTELLDEMQQHVMEMIPFYGEDLTMKISRKIILDYLKGRGFNGSLKARVSFLKQRRDFENFVEQLRLSGVGARYWSWLKRYTEAERRLRPELRQ